MDPHAACTCACSCCGSPTWTRSLKRKLPEPSHGGPHHHSAADISARVEVENEVAALREALSRQQQTIEQLCAELDQEQNAASTAASEAMSMILRLQREKAEVQMEARQFRRFAEERMAHDQDELAALDDLLFAREQAVRSLSCQVQAYRHRLASNSIEDDAPEPDDEAGIDVGESSPTLQPMEFDLPEYEYPPLRCTVRSGDWDGDDDDENVDLDKYTPTTLDKIQTLESRIYELETTPGSSSRVKLMDDKGLDLDFDEFPDADENDRDLDDDEEEDVGDDGSSARVYTIDMVHAVPASRVSDEDEDFLDLVREKWEGDQVVVEGNAGDNGDINKLYKRLQSLEADRESMRQAIISMQTEKTQLVLLKEIAQQLCKEVAPERRIVRKPSLLTTFSIAAVMKWVMSFIFWRKKASRSKYSFGLSKNNAGLLLLLDKSSHVNQWRRLASSRR